ncbi:hypothetical protein K443DRAFT_577929 [Laccaria amethystina LaAM-08-1]|uniref:Uncharacterized protein n=1 Tax=Laccaria amethystina LaAM-08-1 TaxID=1095629 RepID=A0A0C9WRG9_9AGAR|nr:hypothetical protein K443DRAFT_577929 [Laccaria amethystina LaAM-08-1]
MTLTKNIDLPLRFSLEQHVAGYFRPLRLSILFIILWIPFCCFDRHQFPCAKAIHRLSVDDIRNQRICHRIDYGACVVDYTKSWLHFGDKASKKVLCGRVRKKCVACRKLTSLAGWSQELHTQPVSYCVRCSHQ